MALSIFLPKSLSNKNEPIGIAVTILFILIGIYIGYKHYKSPGFWWGILAFILIGSSLFISKDNSNGNSSL